MWEADEILHCKGIDSSLVTPETQALLEHAAERRAWPGTTAVLHTDLLDKEEMDLLKTTRSVLHGCLLCDLAAGSSSLGKQRS